MTCWRRLVGKLKKSCRWIYCLDYTCSSLHWKPISEP